jgi:hypothetical protein
MITSDRSKSGRALVVLAAAASVVVLGALSAMTGPSAAPARADAKYIGVSKCKNCHKSEHSGDQYTVWEKGPHAKAYEALASDAAKKAGAARGVADPQKAPECLKCHVTAYGVDEKQIKKGFKIEDGVQCETCHGPGENHMKARMKAAMSGKTDPAVPAEVGADEIISHPPKETCLGCHNSESPTFERFCYWNATAKIRHWDPRKEHPDAKECAADDPSKCDGCDGKPMKK